MRSLVADWITAMHYFAEARMNRLQSVQNAAACLMTGVERRDHITPVLQKLHWLPVRQRVHFKLATLVYCSLTGTAPYYLSDDCCLTSFVGVRFLRLGDSRTCVPCRAHNNYGARCFATAGPVSGTDCLSIFDNQTFHLLVSKLY